MLGKEMLNECHVICVGQYREGRCTFLMYKTGLCGWKIKDNPQQQPLIHIMAKEKRKKNTSLYRLYRLKKNSNVG